MAKARIFISYAHEDKEWVLEGPGNIHLIPRIRRHTSPDAEIWFDEGLVIGEKWDEEIHSHIVQAHISILLISESFVSSDYIVNKELVWIREQVEQNDMKIVPLLIGNITEKSKRIIDWMVDEFKKAEGIDLSADRMAMQRLREAAEKAKIELSGVMSTNINLPFITAGADGPKHLDMDLTRAKFEEMTADLVERTMGPTRQAMADAGMSASDINKVILVGGSTRIPAVQEAIKKFMGKEPHRGVNPDECVAIGAAIQAGVLAGEVKDVLLLDVTPLSLGIETAGGIFTRMIDRNTTIPTSKSQIFSTYSDNQPSVDIHVLQGERDMAADNKTLGRFELSGIPLAPRGVPKIEVTFDIDANGIVNVKAKDLGTGKEQKITITSSGTLDKDEVDRLVKEAEANAEADKKRKETVEVRNQADSLCYQAEKTIKDMEGKGHDDLIAKVKTAMDSLKETMKGDDVDAIKKATEELTKPLYELSAELYKQTEAAKGAEAGNAGAGEAKKADDDVVDAEVVDDDKK